jgi:hypothetical protein
LHALLFRDWKNRVKGRDFYDFVWYVSRNIPVNLPHLEARIRQSGTLQIESLDLPALHRLLQERIQSVDLAAAAEEVSPFLRNSRELELWSQEFFLQIAGKITVQ